MISATQGKASTIVPTHVQAPIIGPASPLQLLREHICTAEAEPGSRARVARVLLWQHGCMHGGDGIGGAVQDETELLQIEDHTWPGAAHQEWVLTVGTGADQQADVRPNSAGRTTQQDGVGHIATGYGQGIPDSRMYVCHSGGQTRCCFSLVSE